MTTTTKTPTSFPTRLGEAVRRVDSFARVHFIGFSTLWGLLGAGTVGDTSVRSALGLAAIGAAFHLYGGVLNDVVDLPIDQSQPMRAKTPLVQGTISRRTALGFALGQIPIMFGLTWWLGTGSEVFVWLIGAIVAMGLYDLFGKHCPVPPLTDAIQGFSWACMTAVGATLAGGSANRATVLVALFGIAYMMLINGVHGGLRDLENDHASGARTTALFLGVRPVGSAANGVRQVIVPRRAWVFCFALEIAMVVLSFAALSATDSSLLSVTGVAVFVLNAILAYGLVHVLQPNRDEWPVTFRIHVIALLFPIFAAVTPAMGAGLSIFTLVLLLAPLVLLTAPWLMIMMIVNWIKRPNH